MHIIIVITVNATCCYLLVTPELLQISLLCVRLLQGFYSRKGIRHIVHVEVVRHLYN